MKFSIFYSIYSRLIILFISVLFIILFANFLLNQAILYELREQQRIRINSALIECQNTLEQEIERISLNGRFFVVHEERAYLLSKEYPSINAYRLGKEVSEIHNDLLQIKISSDFILDVALYLPGIVRTISTNEYYQTEAPKLVEELDISNLSDNIMSWINNRLFLFIKFPLAYGKKQLYILIIEIDDAIISRHLTHFSNEGLIALIGCDRIILPESRHFSEGNSLNSSSFWQGHIPNNNIQTNTLYRYSPILQAFIVPIFHENQPYKSIVQYQAIQIIILVVTIIFSIYLSYYVFHKIRKPFQKLVYIFNEMEKGDLNARVEYNGNDEFAVVFEKLRLMLKRLRLLIDEKISSEKELRRVELRLLQAQIAPHFIYNSFNILRHAIHTEDLNIAENLTRRLCDYFRYVTYNEQDMLPLSDEYRFACDYLEIQKIRFQERITVDIYPLPDKYKFFLVPRMILQPLIENIFKHGIRDMEYGGKISLYTKTEKEEFMIFVVDNGLGVTENKLKSIRDSLVGDNPAVKHSGLINIYYRLQAAIPGSRLEIHSHNGNGFTAIVVIALKKGNANV